jgi:23S rRNA (pseudouridine1915-N3)-methyltransferase
LHRKTDDKKIAELISYYITRMPKHWNFEMTEIPDAKNARNLSVDLLKKKKQNCFSIR